jgi:hypothetical protein
MLNKILASEDPLDHAGRFASLANAWTNCRKLRLESEELKELKEAVGRLEEEMKKGQGRQK